MKHNADRKLICVFGLGQSGLSVVRYLERVKQDYFVVDSRENPPGKDDLNDLQHCHHIYLGEIPQQKLCDAQMIVLSPGVSPQSSELQEAISKGVSIIGDLELFVRHTSKKIVAITGSNGKSTVTDLTGKLLCVAGINAKVGGNIGVPVLDFLPQDKADVYVLELSSFQLDTLHSLQAEVATVLNVSEDHMDRYPSFDAYRNSKLKIYSRAKHRLANADDKLTHIEDGQLENQQQTKYFSLKDYACDYHLEKMNSKVSLIVNNATLVKADELNLKGSHNWSNVLACLGLLDALNVKVSAPVLNTLKEYQGLPHRFQLTARKDQIDWVNDSKATNVGATEAALNSIDPDYYKKVILIAGGEAKDADLSPLKSSLENKVDQLVLIGRDAEQFAQLADAEKVSFAKDMPAAVLEAKNIVQQSRQQSANNFNALVLLSPACASFDMFKNFEARGQAFADAVREYA